MDTRGAQQLNRIQPQMPAANYTSYQIAAPVSTHWRSATCEEARCQAFLNGWVTTIDESSPLGQFQADYIRGDKTRSCTEEKQPDGMTVFRFGPGQTCFEAGHRVPLDREENFLVTGGDWRGNPRGTPPRRLRAADWVDSFANHQDQLKTALDRG